MRTRLILGILLLVIFLVIFLVTGAAGRVWAEEAPVLLADVNQEPPAPLSGTTSEPVDFFRLGDRLIFSTNSSNVEDDGILWSTDGTAEGTHAVSSSLCPIPCHRIRPLAVWHGLGILRVSSGKDYDPLVRLWRTDGTKAGTFPLTRPLAYDSTFNSLDVASSPEWGVFYFSACRKEPYDCLLWRSDGTRAGTSVLQDARGATFSNPHSLTVWRGRLYFVTGDSYEGEQTSLWSADGTPEGTAFITAVGEGSDWPSVLQATPSRLFFSSGERAEDLWATDGTPAGTRRLVDLDLPVCYPQTGGACDSLDLESMFTVEDKVYFISHRMDHGTEIWSSDGTESGTRPLIELAAGSDISESRLIRLDGRWLVPVSAAPGQPATLWTADGGFTRLEPLSGCAGGACPQEPFVFLHRTDSGAWLFAGRDAAHGDELWITDGTAAGTRLLADTCPGPCAGYRGRYDFFRGNFGSAVFGSTGSAAGKTYFAAFSNPGTDTSVKDELWVTDGTPAGTHRVTGHVSDLAFLGDLAVFGTGGYEEPRSTIGSTDGTTTGTRKVTDLRTVAPGSNPEFHPLRNGVVFLTRFGGRNTLWQSDGRPEGTSRIFEFSPDGTVSPFGESWIQVRNFLLFPVSTGTEDRIRIEIWRTDGTAQGTGRAATLPRDIIWLDLLTSWNGKLLFQIQSSARDCSFWSSDGTAAGTREILPPEPGRRCATAVLALGSRFVFVARAQGPDGLVPQIFVSDGKPEGTRQISRIRSYREALDDDEPAAVGGVAFFQILVPGQAADDSEVWRTDGTPEGTYRAFNLQQPANLYGFRGSLYLSAYLPGSFFGRGLFRAPRHGGAPIPLASAGPFYYTPQYLAPAEFTPLGGRLLFVAEDNAHGTELWVTDGAPEGTRPLRDINPGPKSSLPTGLVAAGDRVFFTAEDGEHGRELWMSDGTAEGTRLVWDLNPGGFTSLSYSVDDPLTVAGGHLFFGADDGETGMEPWSLLLRSAQ